jgi:hypothetical protein
MAALALVHRAVTLAAVTERTPGATGSMRKPLVRVRAVPESGVEGGCPAIGGAGWKRARSSHHLAAVLLAAASLATQTRPTLSEHRKTVLPENAHWRGKSVLVDVDGDGDLDLLPGGQPLFYDGGPLRLFANLGQFRFAYDRDTPAQLVDRAGDHERKVLPQATPPLFGDRPLH